MDMAKILRSVADEIAGGRGTIGALRKVANDLDAKPRTRADAKAEPKPTSRKRAAARRRR